MKRGANIYSIFDATLETYEFLEESIAEGGVVATYLVRDSNGRRFRTSKNMMFASPHDAYVKELARYEAGLKQQREQLNELVQIIIETSQGIEKLRGLVEGTKP